MPSALERGGILFSSRPEACRRPSSLSALGVFFDGGFGLLKSIVFDQAGALQP